KHRHIVAADQRYTQAISKQSGCIEQDFHPALQLIRCAARTQPSNVSDRLETGAATRPTSVGTRRPGNVSYILTKATRPAASSATSAGSSMARTAWAIRSAPRASTAARTLAGPVNRAQVAAVLQMLYDTVLVSAQVEGSPMSAKRARRMAQLVRVRL